MCHQNPRDQEVTYQRCFDTIVYCIAWAYQRVQQFYNYHMCQVNCGWVVIEH